MSASLLASPSITPLPQARRRIFESVFPPNVSGSTPTPLATSTATFIQPPQPPTPTHGYNTRQTQPSPSPATDDGVSLLPSPAKVLAKETRAWHLATSFLSFPNSALPATTREWIESQGSPAKDAIDAIRYLVLNNEDGNVEGRENLIEWYVCEARRHFLGWVKPNCQVPEVVDDPAEVLESILAKLTAAQAIYLYQFKAYLLITQGDASPRKTPRRSSRKKEAVRKEADNNPRIRSFLRSLNSIISYSLPDPSWSELVYAVFLELCGIAVGLSVDGGQDEEKDTDTITSGESTEGDDSAYDKMPQSFMTETDLDGDIFVASDEGDIIIPEEMDGIADFDQFKSQPKGQKAEARRKVLKLWEAMERIGVGGGGRRGERVFAEVINTLITMYIHQSFAERWESPSVAGKELDKWVENVLGRLIVDVLFSSTVREQGGDARLEKLSPRESLRVCRESLDKRRRGGMDIDYGAGVGEEEQKRRKEDLESWKKISVGRLGRLRVSELFDIVVDWPGSLGGVEDLKSYITTPQTRLHLTTTFSAALNSRILHPAAATSDVLGAYIRLIRAFTILDPRGVLLDRVSRSIRRYLRDREDTVRVIVRGIMAESLVASADGEELSELAAELSKGIPALASASGGLEEMDYEDMSWAPDPVDAGPEFRRSKGLDVVGSLISLWESKEVWIKEVQSVLSGRLLQDPTYDFEKEIRTVELLKLRFGDGPTQSCDVMLKDMADSKRVDGTIHDMHGIPCGEGIPEFQTKILSRLYWPSIKKEEFVAPPAIMEIMDAYQQGFERLKKKRKVDWLMTVGTVEVELELEDRMVVVPDATPAQAAVVYAFGDGCQDEDESKSMAFEQLVEELNMSDPTLRNALSFWVEKEVIRESSPGVFTVMETLDSAPGSPHQQSAAAPDQELNQLDEDKLQERTVVEQFIVGMLTNGGAMPSERIFMMLGMLVPGGFRWSSEELGEFLTDLKERKRIEATGSGWKAV